MFRQKTGWQVLVGPFKITTLLGGGRLLWCADRNLGVAPYFAPQKNGAVIFDSWQCWPVLEKKQEKVPGKQSVPCTIFLGGCGWVLAIISIKINSTLFSRYLRNPITFIQQCYTFDTLPSWTPKLLPSLCHHSPRLNKMQKDGENLLHS